MKSIDKYMENFILSSGKFENDKNYWLNKLQGDYKMSGFPTDFQESRVFEYQKSSVCCRLEDSIFQRLYSITQGSEYGMYIILLAGVNYLLYSYTQSEDIVVGIPVFDQGNSFNSINDILPIRTQIDSSNNFKTFLQNMKSVLTEAEQHKNFPIEKIMNMLGIHHESDCSPIFNTIVLMSNIHSREHIENIASDTVFSFSMTQQYLECTIEFNNLLFMSRTVEVILSQLCNIIGVIIQNPDKPMAEIIMTSSEDEKLILDVFNSTESYYPKDKAIHEIFETQVESSPDNVAVIFNDKRLTYSELNERANQLARLLIKSRVGPETIVGIMVERSIEMMVGILGILKAGGAYLPINPDYPEERINYIIEDSGAKLVLVQSNFADKILADTNVIKLDNEDLYTGDNTNIGKRAKPCNLAYVIYTSGSTGKPKGVMIEHASVINRIHWMQKKYALNENDTILQKTPYTFDVSVWELFWWSFAGANVCFLTPGGEKDPSEIINAIENNHITTIHFVPSMLNAFLEYLESSNTNNEAEKISCLKYVFSSGEALTTQQVERFYKSLCDSSETKLINLYGPTEATVDVSFYDCQRNDKSRVIPIGRSIDNINLYIIDKYNRLQPIGVPGELCISGDGLGRGYLNKSMLTAEKFVSNPFVHGERMYKTGDLARWLPDGNIEFLGRMDHQIKIRGFRIELGEIEYVLKSHPYVNESVVLAKEDVSGDKKLIAYFVPTFSKDSIERSETVDKVARDQVDEWKTLFDDKYNKDSSQIDPTFNIVGWDSSYTGEPIPEKEMREWLDSTVSCILSLNPQNVLEIGCGTGMILFKVAPKCRSYYGTDISSKAVKNVTYILDNMKESLPHVEVSNKQADDFSEIAEKFYDVIVLNSVVQYFPDIEYLLSVIRMATEIIKPGGSIFIGDVRNLSLLEVFHTNIQIYKATNDTSIEELVRNITREISLDNELIIHPEFFLALKESFEQISQVEIRYKRGNADNELTRFRYDVILHIGPIQECTFDFVAFWDDGQMNLQTLRDVLQSQTNNMVKINHVPNSRIAYAIKSWQILNNESNLESLEYLKSKIEKCIDFITATAGDFTDIGVELGYDVEFLWPGYGEDLYYDVVFMKKSIVRDTKVGLIPSFVQKPEGIKAWHDYVNNPLKGKIIWELATEIREYVKTKLPGYMIPSYFIQIDNLPLTSSGKLDRKALPEPETKVNAGEEYESPRNEIEAIIAEIWQGILETNRVGINYNFFNLGGDSIKAISLISRINKKLKSNVQMKDIYLYPTIKELVAVVHKNTVSESGRHLEIGLEIIEDFKNRIFTDKNQSMHLSEDFEDIYPISQIQQGMVLYSKLKPEEPIYLDQFLYQLRFKDFNINFFKLALNMLIQKHEILRTSFNLTDFTQPIQIVYKTYVPEISIEDISNLENRGQEEFVRRYLVDDLYNKFLFHNDILWRLRIFKRNTSDYCMVLSFHHAILDGWSVATFVSEFLEVYRCLVTQTEYKISKNSSSYKDYVAIGLSRKVSIESSTFWRETLAGYSRNKLPFNISGKKISNTNKGKIIVKDLDSTVLNRLESQATKYGVTLKELCISAYVYLLNIITTEDDVTTGIVSHDRPEIEGAENILGCFLNTIPIRINVGSCTSRIILLQKVKEFMRKVKEHELFLSDITNIIGESGNSGNPIFDTIFNYIDFHILKRIEKMGIVEEVGFELELEPNEMTNTPFDFEVSRTLDKFSIRIKYDPSYFYEKDMRKALDIYINILDSFINDMDGKLNRESLILEDEKNELIYGFNNTNVPFSEDKLIHHLFEDQAARIPHQIAVVFGNERIEYKELNIKSNKLAWKLINNGVKSGDNVAIIVRRSPDLIIGLLAILKSGAAYVPIDPDYPLDRKEYIIQNSNVSAVLVDGEYGIQFINKLTINDNNLDIYSEVNPNIKKDSRDLSYTIYTSGSTGQPKGVMIEHRSAVNLINWVNTEFGVNENDILLFVTSMCFDLSVYDIFGILSAGGTIVIAKKDQIQNPQELKEILEKEKITFWNSVPSTLNYLVNTFEEMGDMFRQYHLRLAFLSGDWIPVRLSERITKYFPNCKVISLGGATEGTVWSIYYPIEKVDKYQASIPYGRPIDNNYFYILDKDMDVVPYGVAGELYIGGIGVARGYANDPEKTRISFHKNRFIDIPGEMMYKTGDMGRMLPDGNIEFLGRIDYQVKIRGYRIELGEIENVLLTHPCIQEAVVVDRQDKQGNKYLCAYIVSNKQFSIIEIKEHISSKLPEYMMPAHFMKLDRLPLTLNGKIDRKALPEPDGSINVGVEYVAPHNLMEEKLVDLWQDVLGVDKVGINDNFFDLGGNSILMLQILGRMEKEFGSKVTATDLFTYTTISKLTEFMEQGKTLGYKELKIEGLTLPDDYFINEVEKKEESVFEFEIMGDMFNKIHNIAQLENISVNHFLLATYMYLFTEISGHEEIMIQTIALEKNKVLPLKINIANIEDYSGLFTLLSECIEKAQSDVYSVEDIGNLAFEKDNTMVIPLFFNKSLFIAAGKPENIFDISLEVDEDTDEILFKCAYDSSRLKEEKMEEFTNGYIKLIKLLISQY